MRTFTTYEMKQSFWKSVKYLWRYGIFAGKVYMLKVENFKSSRRAKFSPFHCKSKIPAHMKFSAQIPSFNMCEMKQSFWKSVKYLWRYWIFAGTVYRLKVGNFKSCRWAKFSPCHCKTRIPAHPQYSVQMPTVLHVSDECKVFGNRLGYLSIDEIFAWYSFTSWKWEISNLVDGLSFHLVIAKLKYLRIWNFWAKWRTFNTFEMKQSFWKSVKYLPEI